MKILVRVVKMLGISMSLSRLQTKVFYNYQYEKGIISYHRISKYRPVNT